MQIIILCYVNKNNMSSINNVNHTCRNECQGKISQETCFNQSLYDIYSWTEESGRGGGKIVTLVAYGIWAVTCSEEGDK